MEEKAVGPAQWYVYDFNPYNAEMVNRFQCGRCKGKSYFLSKYCPNCGARMSEGWRDPRKEVMGV